MTTETLVATEEEVQPEVTEVTEVTEEEVTEEEVQPEVTVSFTDLEEERSDLLSKLEVASKLYEMVEEMQPLALPLVEDSIDKLHEEVTDVEGRMDDWRKKYVIEPAELEIAQAIREVLVKNSLMNHKVTTRKLRTQWGFSVSIKPLS